MKLFLHVTCTFLCMILVFLKDMKSDRRSLLP